LLVLGGDYHQQPRTYNLQLVFSFNLPIEDIHRRFDPVGQNGLDRAYCLVEHFV